MEIKWAGDAGARGIGQLPHPNPRQETDDSRHHTTTIIRSIIISITSTAARKISSSERLQYDTYRPMCYGMARMPCGWLNSLK